MLTVHSSQFTVHSSQLNSVSLTLHHSKNPVKNQNKNQRKFHEENNVLPVMNISRAFVCMGA